MSLYPYLREWVVLMLVRMHNLTLTESEAFKLMQKFVLNSYRHCTALVILMMLYSLQVYSELIHHLLIILSVEPCGLESKCIFWLQWLVAIVISHQVCQYLWQSSLWSFPSAYSWGTEPGTPVSWKWTLKQYLICKGWMLCQCCFRKTKNILLRCVM